MAGNGMPEWTKLAIALAGIGSIAYGLQMPEDDLIRWVFIVPGVIVLLGALFMMFGYGKYASRLGFRSGKVSMTTIAAIAIVIAVGWLVFTGGNLSIIPQNVVPTHTEEQGELIAMTLPIKFTFAASGVSFAALDSLANPPAATLESVAIYKDGVLVETISLSAPGGGIIGASFGPYEATTSMKYRSGEHLHLVLTYDIGGGNYAVQSVDVVVPYVNKEEAEILPPVEHDITVDVGVVPASLAAINVYDNTGASVTTLTGGETYTLSVILPEDHAGFVTATVPQATGGEVKYVGGIVIVANASTLDIPGAKLVYQGVDKYIYFIEASGDITITFRYIGGAATSVKIIAYQGIDLDYLSRLGTINSEATSIGSVSLTGSA